MTIINQKSISGITSITFASAGDDLLTFHSNNGTERFRIDNSGNTKITAGIVTTLTTTGNATVGGTLGVTGETTFSTHVNLGDSDQLRFGASNDLVIQHNGSDSLISETGTGDLYIRGSNNIYLQKGDGSETFTATNDDGAVELYYDNSKKFETTTNGVTVTGRVECDEVRAGDDDKIQLGDSQDFRVYHDGSTNIIDGHYHPIELRHQSEVHAKFVDDGAVELYHNNVKKFETTNTGVKIDNSSTTDMILLDVGGTNFAKLGHNSASGTDILDIRSEGHTRFLTNGNNERVRILSSGGITFNGDTAAANALDDYEEGTWTAAINTTNNNATVSANNTTGYYVKVGNMVHAHYYTEATSVTSAGTSSAVLTGLPFTVANLTSGYAVATVTHTTLFTTQVQNGYAGPNQTRIVFVGEGTTSSMSLATGSNKYLMVSLTYRAA